MVGSILGLLIAANLVWAIFSIVRAALGPCKSQLHSVSVSLRRYPVQPSPDVDLDPFKFCAFKLWNAGSIVFYTMSMFFGMPSPSNPLSRSILQIHGIADVLVLSILLFTSRGRRVNVYRAVPSLLDAIVRDATLYFAFIFSAHLLSLLFLFVTSVGVA